MRPGIDWKKARAVTGRAADGGALLRRRAWAALSFRWLATVLSAMKRLPCSVAPLVGRDAPAGHGDGFARTSASLFEKAILLEHSPAPVGAQARARGSR